MAWVRTFGKGRVFYTSLGHSTDSQKNPNFIKLVSRGVRWVAEKPEPALPEKDGIVSIPTQGWPLKPGPALEPKEGVVAQAIFRAEREGSVRQ